jgi:D-alanine-D-alanine ligase
MKIILLLDFEEVNQEDPHFESPASADNNTMEFHMVKTLRILGHQVRVIGFGPDVKQTIRDLATINPDLVFNLTEKADGDRRKDLNVAALLELLNIPYTGAGPIGLMLGRDKALSKFILEQYGLKVPGFESLPVGTTTLRKNLKFPIIVKPQMGDGSECLNLKSVVSNHDDLASRTKVVHEQLDQPAICEEFIGGRELKVFIYGNKKLTMLPVGELKFGCAGNGGPNFATARVKTDPSYREKWRITYNAANLPPDLEAEVARYCKKAYKLLDMRDYGRLDMRLTEHGEICFLEANPNPTIRPRGFGGVADWAGVDYTYLIDRITKLALQRK